MVESPPSFSPDCGARVEAAGDHRWTCVDCGGTVHLGVTPVSSAAVVRGEEVLCIERGRPPAAGEWSVPGEHVEPGESPAEAAVRELREETAVRADVDSVRLVGVGRLPSHGGAHAVSVDYAVPWADVSGDPTAGDDAAAVGWLSRDPFGERGAGSPPQAYRQVESALATFGRSR